MQLDTKWTAMWGNAMSIAEHKAEEYSKNITLRYPVYAPLTEVHCALPSIISAVLRQ